jgi:heat shock protein HslJ
MRVIDPMTQRWLRARLLLFPFLSLLACAAEGQPEERGRGAALSAVDWRLTTIKTPDQTFELQPSDGVATLRFSEEQAAGSEQGRRVSGDTGCNSFEGTYTLPGDQAISIDDLTVTEIFCGERAFAVEQAYLSALWSVDSYELAGGALQLVSTASGFWLTFTNNGR